MKETYQRAMAQVFEDEGGYSNDAGDPGGPTNWGITIHDARQYWKPDATAADVRKMPKSVASDIYAKHYATPLHYDELPAGVDYTVLDYGINSGISRSARVLQKLVGAKQDGVIGPETIKDVHAMDATKLINGIYDERLAFLKSLKTWSIFGKGWGRRCATGRKLALQLAGTKPSAAPVIAATAATMALGASTVTTGAFNHHYLWVGSGVLLALTLTAVLAYFTFRKNTNVQPSN